MLATAKPTISSLTYYPLKSGKGIKADTMTLTSTGPKNDRLWMLVDKNGEKISQRNKGCEKMALIETKVHENGDVTFKAPGQKTLVLMPSSRNSETSEFSVHSKPCHGHDHGDEAAQWFEEYLGQPCRLVAYAYGQPRHVDTTYSQNDDMIGFADEAPLLVTSTSSFEALSDHFPENANIDMDRFRPNIVIDGLKPFEEDVIYKVRIGEVVLEFGDPRGRCVLTTVDQETGEKIKGSNEPMGTLVKTRRGKGGGLQGVFFGQNAIPRALGTIKVGDEVEILSKRPLHPVLEVAALKFGS